MDYISEMKQKKSHQRGQIQAVYAAIWTRRQIGWRIVMVLLAIWLLITVQAWAIAQWYIQKHANEPLNVGVTFVSNHAEHFGLDPQDTFKALRDDIGFRRFRLVTYWKDIQPTQGTYDFSDIDWQLKMINEVGGTATVSIGLRQPRWPECHFPDWTSSMGEAEWQPLLQDYLAKTVTHLKNNKAVVSYQLENEYFLSVFGECPVRDRQQLIDEFELVKKIDPDKPVVMSLANNYFGIPTGQPRADQVGISVYKRVWDETITKRYFEYPFTPTYYAYRAGLTEIFTGRSSMLHELQAEPWAPKGMGGVPELSIEEQNKSMDVERLKNRIEYGKATGFRDIDLWGGEWWYWRKTKKNDPTLWNAVKNALAEANAKEQNRLKNSQ